MHTVNDVFGASCLSHLSFSKILVSGTRSTSGRAGGSSILLGVGTLGLPKCDFGTGKAAEGTGIFKRRKDVTETRLLMGNDLLDANDGFKLSPTGFTMAGNLPPKE